MPSNFLTESNEVEKLVTEPSIEDLKNRSQSENNENWRKTGIREESGVRVGWGTLERSVLSGKLA